MKKWIITALSLFMTVSLGACSAPSASTSAETTAAASEIMESAASEHVETAEEETAEDVQKTPDARIIMERISSGSDQDIVSGVTSIDTSAIWTPVENIDFSPKADVLIQNTDGTQVSMAEPYFTSEAIADGTWKLSSDGDNFYLLEGDEIALLIDTGYGAGSVCNFKIAKNIK